MAALVLPVLSACAGPGFSRVENPFLSSFYDRSAVDRAFRDTKMPVVIARPLGGIEASTGGDIVLEALERGYPRQSAGFTRVTPPEGTVPDGYYLVVQPGGNVTSRPDACTPRAIHMTDTGAPTCHGHGAVRHTPPDRPRNLLWRQRGQRDPGLHGAGNRECRRLRALVPGAVSRHDAVAQPDARQWVYRVLQRRTPAHTPDRARRIAVPTIPSRPAPSWRIRPDAPTRVTSGMASFYPPLQFVWRFLLIFQPRFRCEMQFR
ncbi:hypothetical protein ACFQ4K_26385 [Tistrella bauzanensis]